MKNLFIEKKYEKYVNKNIVSHELIQSIYLNKKNKIYFIRSYVSFYFQLILLVSIFCFYLYSLSFKNVYYNLGCIIFSVLFLICLLIYGKIKNPKSNKNFLSLSFENFSVSQVIKIENKTNVIYEWELEIFISFLNYCKKTKKIFYTENLQQSKLKNAVFKKRLNPFDINFSIVIYFLLLILCGSFPIIINLIVMLYNITWV